MTLLSVSCAFVVVPGMPLRPLTRRSFTGRAVLDEAVLSSAISVAVGADPVRRTVRSAPGDAVNGATGVTGAVLNVTVTAPAGTRTYGPTLGELSAAEICVPFTTTLAGVDGDTLAATRARGNAL